MIITSEQQLQNLIAAEMGKFAQQINLSVAKVQRPWLTRKEAIDYTGFSESKFDQLVSDGTIPKRVIGKSPVFYREDLDSLPQAVEA